MLMGWAVRYSEVLESTSKVEIVEWVAENYTKSALTNVKAEDLSQASVPVLTFLNERKLATSGFEDPRLVDLVATMGKMETLRLLLEREDEGRALTRCTQDAMDGAAANGHLEIVEYFHRHRTEECTVAAMDGAAQNGHMEVVEFLHTERTEGCTVAAMDGAARNGHLDMVMFLHTYRGEGCSTAAMDNAAAGVSSKSCVFFMKIATKVVRRKPWMLRSLEACQLSRFCMKTERKDARQEQSMVLHGEDILTLFNFWWQTARMAALPKHWILPVKMAIWRSCVFSMSRGRHHVRLAQWTLLRVAATWKL